MSIGASKSQSNTTPRHRLSVGCCLRIEAMTASMSAAVGVTVDKVTLHQLRCFDAVVSEGGFQAGADALHRSQPTVFAAVKGLESQLGLTLLDRSGYRVSLTDPGRAFHARVRVFLHEFDRL